MSNNEVCSICMDDGDYERLRLKRCKHEFHKCCIVQWHESFLKKDVGSRCPLCRSFSNLITLCYDSLHVQRIQVSYQQEETISEFIQQMEMIGENYSTHHGLIKNDRDVIAYPIHTALKKTFGELDLRNKDKVGIELCKEIFVFVGEKTITIVIPKSSTVGTLFYSIRKKIGDCKFVIMYQGKILNQQTQDHILITDLNIQNYQTLYLSFPDSSFCPKTNDKKIPKPKPNQPDTQILYHINEEVEDNLIFPRDFNTAINISSDSIEREWDGRFEDNQENI